LSTTKAFLDVLLFKAYDPAVVAKPSKFILSFKRTGIPCS